MRVPLLDLCQQNQTLRPGLIGAFERLLSTGQFILGEEVAQFEQQIAAMAGVRQAIGVSSGTDAILLALMALGIGPGDEVLCPSFTFFATAGCVARVGARPVFVDSCPACFNLDVADAARRVTAKTKAIIPVHLFGQAAAMGEVMELARKHQLAVIEDGAQALGAEYGGQPVGSIGHFGTFSFFPSKNLGAFGDAGMLVTNDDALAERARILRVHGSQPKYYHKLVGGNFRLDALQAALLSVKLPHLASYSEKRQANAAYYTERLGKIPGVVEACSPECVSNEQSSSGAKILLPAPHARRTHIWNQYTIRVSGPGRRDALRNHLAKNEIGAEVYYPLPLHRQECFAYLGQPEPGLPQVERLSAECLSLPIYPELTRAQQDWVIEAISQFV